MNERQNNMDRAEALFFEELISFVRTLNARSKMILEAAENLKRRRAVVEAARRMEEETDGQEPN